ncbi:hypothetical protein GF361_03580 [Candidatus Woesearchaeota archaeon]|nr:hypothetical protein [Candidatus Woesearchaeota archaeon]
MKIKFLSLIFAVLFLGFVLAQNIEYPVSELGNCASEKECKTYCDNLENAETCLSFAKKYNLMSEEELEEAKNMLQFLSSGETPGGCENKNECEEYCSDENNVEECIEFGLKTGSITEEEVELKRKTKGKGPGDCQGKEECDAYCSKEGNFEECIEFAHKQGIISEEEYETGKKTRGKGPGGCRGEECEGYCEDESHFEECAEFAYENGFISQEEYEMSKNTGGKGPGGCEGQEECDEYCKTHEVECLNFALENNIIDEEELLKGKSEEEKCMFTCMLGKNIAPEECHKGAGPQNEECMKCAGQCGLESGYEGPCLTSEEIKKFEKECKAKGKTYWPEHEMGEDPDVPGSEEWCIIDLKCVDHSDEFGKIPDKEGDKKVPEKNGKEVPEGGGKEMPEPSGEEPSE